MIHEDRDSGNGSGNEFGDESYYPDPEDFLPTPPKEKGPLSKFPSSKYLFSAMLCFVIFVIMGFFYWQKYPVGQNFWVSGESIFQKHEYWRLFSALFTHGDGVHLLSNMPLFIIFGWFLRAYFGPLVFPGAAIFSGLISNLFTIAVYEPRVRLLGASGMDYGMVALWLVFYVRHDTDHRVPVRIFRAAGFALAMLVPTTVQSTTSYTAHAAGFAAGLVIGLLLLPFVRVNENPSLTRPS
ncbi:MAG: rhomboid family intramembrane serine protease [bacterium]|nr:rhomboid family intramembrane serine protease [bacterium]